MEVEALGASPNYPNIKGEWNPNNFVHSINAETLEKENSESLSKIG